MSKLTDNLNFDFSAIGKQGAYLSSYTPQSLQDYFKPVFIPKESSYHLIGCYNPSLMARSNLNAILLNYLDASEKLKQTSNYVIIDLCLPFYDEKSKRTFLGRHIIFKGTLIGIRLNTGCNTYNSAFYSWPRHRARMATISILGKEINLLVGQISLNLLNLRIGLLFQSQIHTSLQEYVNCGFDFISLTYENSHPSIEAISLKNDFSKKILFLESEIGSIDHSITNERISKLFFHDEASIQSKNVIYIEYYQFQKGFTCKRLLYLSEQQLFYITPLEIQVSFMQTKIKKQIAIDQNYKIEMRSFTLTSNEGDASFLNKYLKRLYMFYQRSNQERIVVILQDTPHIISFLYIISIIIRQNKKQTLNLQKIFKYVYLASSNLFKYFKKFRCLQFLNKKQIQHKVQYNTADIVNVLDTITQGSPKQSYFPIITADIQIVNILQMLNQRQTINLQKGESNKNISILQNSNSSEKLSEYKTWIATDFFTCDEVKQIYFSQGIVKIFNDREVLSEIWRKYYYKNNVTDQTAYMNDYSYKFVSNVENYQRLSQILKKSNILMKQFQQHFDKVKQVEANINKEQIFSHFLFRKTTNLPIKQTHQIPNNLMTELLLISQKNIFKIFKFIHCQTFLTHQQHFTSRLALSAIALARQQAQTKLKCHLCEYSFFRQLIYICRTQICKQAFCYECLLKFPSFEQKKMFNLNQNIKCVKLCPICKGQCLNCRKCLAKKNRLFQQGEKSINILGVECHYCKKDTSIYHYTCSQQKCRKSFCLKCIQQCYRVTKNDYKQNQWICFVCLNRCYCNNCQLQKEKLMSIAIQRPIRTKKQNQKSLKIIQKQTEKNQISMSIQKKRGRRPTKSQKLQIKSVKNDSQKTQHLQSEFHLDKISKQSKQFVNEFQTRPQGQIQYLNLIQTQRLVQSQIEIHKVAAPTILNPNSQASNIRKGILRKSQRILGNKEGKLQQIKSKSNHEESEQQTCLSKRKGNFLKKQIQN